MLLFRHVYPKREACFEIAQLSFTKVKVAPNYFFFFLGGGKGIMWPKHSLRHLQKIFSCKFIVSSIKLFDTHYACPSHMPRRKMHLKLKLATLSPQKRAGIKKECAKMAACLPTQLLDGQVLLHGAQLLLLQGASVHAAVAQSVLEQLPVRVVGPRPVELHPQSLVLRVDASRELRPRRNCARTPAKRAAEPQYSPVCMDRRVILGFLNTPDINQEHISLSPLICVKVPIIVCSAGSSQCIAQLLLVPITQEGQLLRA